LLHTGSVDVLHVLLLTNNCLLDMLRLISQNCP